MASAPRKSSGGIARDAAVAMEEVKSEASDKRNAASKDKEALLEAEFHAKLTPELLKLAKKRRRKGRFYSRQAQGERRQDHNKGLAERHQGSDNEEA